MILAIWIALIILAIIYAVALIKDITKHKSVLENISVVKTAIIGFVVNFFDTLGIGSFAPQTALLKFTKQTEDRLIPGTLNVSNTIPVLIQALIFIKIVEVEVITLITMLLSATAGAILGAGIVSKLSVRKIQLTMGFALLVTAFFMLSGQMEWIQGGGEAIGLTGWKLAVAIGANFVLGAFMTAGIGMYAPCMALIYGLGMSPLVAFPIMMGSCAFLMPPASVKFIKEGAYNRKASLAMIIPGIIAVLIAAFFVKSLPLNTLRWVVIGVVLYTSFIMLKSAKQGNG
ncbi:MAG: sulfite exporter TauE/SafE family protein [Flavobacteriaceae bacterium]|nr:sulfite exporter TauE/SafE family protein [Flavobacteriaceae bacterium]